MIDWLEGVARAILDVIGPVPERPRAEPAAATRSKSRWIRPEVDAAVAAIAAAPAGVAAGRLLAHADANQALFVGGVSAEPSAGIYYRVGGQRRSLWSLFLTADRPFVTLNLRPVWDRSPQLAHQALALLRRNQTLDAALLRDDDTLVRKYPSLELAKLGEDPAAIDAVIAAVELVVATGTS